MSKFRGALRRAVQVVACASALAGGVGAAHLSKNSATASQGGTARAPMEAEAPPQSTDPLTLASALVLVRTTPIELELHENPSNTAIDEAPQPPPAIDEATDVAASDTFAEDLQGGMVITGATSHRLILFSFDDGPDPRHTPRLLDTLDRYGVKALFFLTASRFSGGGPWQRRNQALAREIVRQGHMVANHTIDHLQLPLLDDASVIAQVRGADAIFERVLGERTWLMRPPGGARSHRVDGLLAAQGYTQVHWNLGTGDFQVREPEEVFRVFKRVLERRERDFGERGGIVLLHDTHGWSVDAVPMILDHLRSENCRLLAEGEELYDVVDTPRFFFAPRGEADVSTEAPSADPDPHELAERQMDLRLEARARCGMLAGL